MKRILAVTATLLCLIPAFCGCQKQQEESSAAATYTRIDAAAAAELMETQTGYIILDVRRQDEFDAGHIPNAVCIPNESIGTEEIPTLPDKDQLIMVYCRSGRRSKEAAQKLADLGYTNVVEFGGIIDWNGETVTEDN